MTMSEVVTRVKAGDPISRQPEFHDWLREHHLDPDCVASVVIHEDFVNVGQFVENGDGQKFTDAMSGDAVYANFTIRKTSEPPY
jgi:hypothetical protein